MLVRYLSYAILLPVATLVGYAIGYGLDNLFSTHFLRTVFLMLGGAAGFAQLVRSLSNESK
jgi:F0F1-type ATP synthase assembly protein I